MILLSAANGIPHARIVRREGSTHRPVPGRVTHFLTAILPRLYGGWNWGSGLPRLPGIVPLQGTPIHRIVRAPPIWTSIPGATSLAYGPSGHRRTSSGIRPTGFRAEAVEVGQSLPLRTSSRFWSSCWRMTAAALDLLVLQPPSLPLLQRPLAAVVLIDGPALGGVLDLVGQPRLVVYVARLGDADGSRPVGRRDARGDLVPVAGP